MAYAKKGGVLREEIAAWLIVDWLCCYDVAGSPWVCCVVIVSKDRLLGNLKAVSAKLS